MVDEEGVKAPGSCLLTAQDAVGGIRPLVAAAGELAQAAAIRRSACITSQILLPPDWCVYCSPICLNNFEICTNV